MIVFKITDNSENYKLLKENGFKFCLVSPELQGQVEKLEEYKKYLNNNIFFDEICTKISSMDKWDLSYI